MADKTLPGSYVSVNDFIKDATGINTATLQPAILPRFIARASRWADRKCRQPLYTTLNSDTLLLDSYPEGYSVDGSGFIKAFPAQFPIQTISSLSYQPPMTSTATVIDPTTAFAMNRWLRIEGYWSFLRKMDARLLLGYTAGFCINTTSAAVSAGATAIPMNTLPQIGVVSTETTLNGWQPGQLLEIQDDVNTELVTIASVSGLTINTVAPLAFAHTADTMLADPMFANAQQAVILLASVLIKTRGVGPVALRDENVRREPASQEDMDLENQADALLSDFKVYA